MRTSKPLLLALVLAAGASVAGEGDCDPCSYQVLTEPETNVLGSCCSCEPLHTLKLVVTCCDGDLALVQDPPVPDEPCDPASPSYSVAYPYRLLCGGEPYASGVRTVTYHRDCGDGGCQGGGCGLAGAGTDTPSPYPDGRPPAHLFRLGMSRHGKPVGVVRLQVEPGDSGSAKAGALQPILQTAAADLVYDPATPQLLRQVMSAECLLAISTNALSGYELRYYHPADVAGELDPDGFYQPLPNAVPFAAYSVRQDGPRLSVSGGVGGASRTNGYVQAAGGGWTLLRAVLLSETVATNFADGVLTATRTASRPDGGAARTTVDTRAAVAGALRLASRVEDPAGAALTTRWSYSGSGRLELEERPDGSWTRYRRDAAGLCVAEVSPLGDQPPGTVDALCRVVSNAYAAVDALDTGEAEWLDRPRTVSTYEAGILVSRTYHAYYRTAGGERVEIAERAATPTAAYGDPANLRTKRTWYAKSASEPWSDEPRFVESPGGLLETFAYEAGVLDASDPDPALWSFVPDATGSWVRATATHGTADSPDGIPGRTLRETSVRDAFGRALLEETWACSGPTNYARLAWTATARAALGRAASVVRSDGTVSETVWGCCGPESETGPDGVRTEYAYDALGRRVLALREGLPGVSADRYEATAYDVHGRVLSKTVSAGGLSFSTTNAYDAAGRPVWTRGPDGVGTLTVHGSNSTATVRGGYGQAPVPVPAATNLAVRFADGRPHYEELNGVRKATYAYGANADGTRWTTVHEGPLGAASPVWTKTTTDFLGRALLEERPAYGGGTLVASNAYESGTGRLLSTTQSHNPNPGNPVILSTTLFSYDSLGELVLTAQDLDLDGETDLAGPDRVAGQSVQYWYGDPGAPGRSLGEGWWRESASWTYPGDGSSAPFTNSVARTRLTGLGAPYAAPPPGIPSGDWLLASESVSLDALGNATVSRALLDRDARRALQCTDVPGSILDAWTLAVDGLSLTNSTATGVVSSHAYDALGRRSTTTDGRGNATAYEYDAFGRLASESRANGASPPFVTTYGYDALNRRTSSTDPLDQTTHTAYDAEGRVTATWGATYPVAYEYDAFGRMVAMQTFRDEALQAGDETRWLYDEPTGLLTNKVYADGKGTAYSYTPDGKLATRTWARGVTTTYAYTNGSSLAAIDYSDGTPDVTFAYDRVGRQVSATVAGVSTNLYAYSLLGHLTNEVVAVLGVLGSWRETLSRTQDPFARDTGFSLGPDYSVAYGYDEYGRFHSVSSSVASVVSVATYAYLPGSHLLAGHTQGDFTRAVTYEPNRDLIAAVSNTWDATLISAFGYGNDAIGRRTAIARSGSAFGGMPVRDAYGYNVRSEVTSARRALADDPNQEVRGFSYDYAYDPIGNRTSSTEYDPDNNALVSAYTANALNQYSLRTVPGHADVRGEAATNAVVTVNANPAWRLGEYLHGGDAADNSASAVMKELEVMAVVNPPGTNDADMVQSVTGRVFVARTPETFQYDDDGNLIQDGRFNYAWNGENCLIAAETRDGLPASVPRVKVEYAYDHRGRMVWKTVAPSNAPPTQTISYVWDDYNIVAEHVVSDSGTNVTYNVWGVDLSGSLQGAGGVGGLIACVSSFAPFASLAVHVPSYDANGNVSEYLSTNGTIAAHYEYDPFGNTAVQSGDLAYAFTHRFSTKPWCPVTGLSEYQFRPYGPALGRWISRDPIGLKGGHNSYSFVVNSPVLRKDRFGLMDCDCCRTEVAKAWQAHPELLQLAQSLVSRKRRSPVTGVEEGCLKTVMCQGCSDKPKELGGWYGGHANTFLYPGRYVVVCCDAGLGFPGASDVPMTLRHELQHARDWCDGKLDDNCASCLCGEIRAFYCSGACNDMDSCIAMLKANNYFTVHCPCSNTPDKNSSGGNLDEIEALARSCAFPTKADCAFPRPGPTIAKPQL